MKNNISFHNRGKSTISLFILIHSIFFCGQGITIAQDTESVSIRNLRQHMDSIASDPTEGRFTGSAGYRKAAEYAANVLLEAGLNPGYTDDKGEKSYFQPVPFIHTSYASSSITIRENGKDETFSYSTGDFVIIKSGPLNRNVQMTSPAFIGYGINEPEYRWDDYADLNLQGKWVIVIDEIPKGDANQAFSDNLRKKYADRKTYDSLRYIALIKYKVAGLIVLPYKHEIDNWEGTLLHSHRDCFRYANDEMSRKETSDSILPVILAGPEIVKILFAGQTFDPITNNGNYHSYMMENIQIGITIKYKEEPIKCYNVIGIVPGTDSALQNEYLTVGAHLDHLGKFGEHVYNGANDDASGCVIILEAAKSIALNPPKRPVLFVLYTAEELGLTGSKHFVNYPPVPIEKILLNINIEQIGSKNRDFQGIWAIGSLQFRESFYKTGNSLVNKNLRFDLIEDYKDVLKNNVDLWSYYQKGIAGIMLSSGGFKEHHKIEDKIDLIDFEHLYMAEKLLHSFIIELGNEPQYEDTE